MNPHKPSERKWFHTKTKRQGADDIPLKLLVKQTILLTKRFLQIYLLKLDPSYITCMEIVSLHIYIYSKYLETESIFTKTETNNEWNVSFPDNCPTWYSPQLFQRVFYSSEHQLFHWWFGKNVIVWCWEVYILLLNSLDTAPSGWVGFYGISIIGGCTELETS